MKRIPCATAKLQWNGCVYLAEVFPKIETLLLASLVKSSLECQHRTHEVMQFSLHHGYGPRQCIITVQLEVV